MSFPQALCACVLLLLSQTALAAPITGVVHNKTTGKDSPGDTVALIDLNGTMQVASQTTTDVRGHYTLEAPDTGTHLIRVSHEKAAYFQPVPAGAHTVDIDVYDVAASVEGITTEADVLSMQTAPGGLLRVTEDFFVRNSSAPPRTQLSDHAYEFFLPEGAKVEGTAAMGPGGMPVESTPVPLAGKGHYGFVFPVRPGETRFQIGYTLPYDGKSLSWTQREALSTENLVVLLPKAMRFTPRGTEWQPVPANPDAQTFVRKGVVPGAPVEFSLAGQGELPREAQGNTGGNTPGDVPNGGGNTPGTGASTATDTRPGGGLGPPIDTPDPLHRYKGWLLGGLGVLLLCGAWWLMRAKPQASTGAREPFEPAPGESRALRPALERALLALEREHALGALPEPEYLESRAALQRALHRGARAGSGCSGEHAPLKLCARSGALRGAPTTSAAALKSCCAMHLD